MTTADVAVRQQTDLTQEHPADAGATLLDVILRAATDPRIDADKMAKLLEIRLAVEARAAEASFNQALARVKRRLPRIEKNGTIAVNANTHIKFMRYEDIADIVQPILDDEGFTVSYSSDLVSVGSATMLKVSAKLRHRDGHSDVGSIFVPPSEKSGAKNEVQGVGSVNAYARRYVLCGLLDIVAKGEDDDGTQGAMKPLDERQLSEITDLLTVAKEKAGDADLETKFLSYMNVESVEKIIRGDFQKAKTALQQKAKPAKGTKA